MIQYLFRTIFTALILSLILASVYFITKNPMLKDDENTLNVFVWGDLISHDNVKKFEEKYDINVNLHYYTSNEEMLSKLRHRKGKGYDIIFPSDYAVKTLRDEGYIQPLKKELIPEARHIEPFLLGHEYDPDNTYALPYLWEAFVIASDSEFIDEATQPSFDQLFDPNAIDYKIVMTQDPVEAFTMASHYLFNKSESLNKDEVRSIQKLLRVQKNWVEAYADFRAKYMISTKNCPLVLLKTSYIDSSVKENPDIRFTLPKEGIFMSLENIVISSTCKNEKAAHKFINHLFKPENMAECIDTWPMYPTNPDAIRYYKKHLGPEYFQTFDEVRERTDFFFINYPIPPDQIRELWLKMKSLPPLPKQAQKMSHDNTVTHLEKN